MKYLMRTVSLIMVLSIFFFSTLTSCKKEKIVETTVIDTVTVSDETPITTSLVSATPWMIEEKRGLNGGALVYYLRGGSSNTESFDNEFVKFNSDNTGLYHDNAGFERVISWHFTNADNSALVFTLVNTPATFDIHWENMRSKNGTLYFDQYFTDGNTGNNNHSVDSRIPKP